MALIRTLLSFCLLLSAIAAVGALVLHSLVRHRYDDSTNNFDNNLHGWGITGAGLGIIASVFGLLMTWTRNLHRRPLTHVFDFLAAATLITIGGAIAVLAVYHNAINDLPRLVNAALGCDAGLALFMLCSLMLYIHKSMEEFAVGHK